MKVYKQNIYETYASRCLQDRNEDIPNFSLFSQIVTWIWVCSWVNPANVSALGEGRLVNLKKCFSLL